MPKQLLLPAFEDEIKELNVDDIVLTKEITPSALSSTKFNIILTSIKEIGIIEAPMVTYKDGQYQLLDGHLRIHALKKLGIKKVNCLLAKDDEGFTYNKHVNRLSNIQEHKMIVKAIERGVSMARLAKVLNMDITSIIHKKNLLVGIDAETAELLKDKIVCREVFSYLRKMKPARQVEAAKLMNDMNNYSAKFARSIWLASSDKQLINPLKRPSTVDMEKLARLENEVSSLQGEYSIMEDKYGIDVLNLTLVKGYIRNLFDNNRVKEFLNTHEPDIYRQFEKIIELDDLNATTDRLL